MGQVSNNERTGCVSAGTDRAVNAEGVDARVRGGQRQVWRVRAIRSIAYGIASTALATAAFVAPSTLPAAAEPPVTVADAKAQIEQLQIDAAAIDQQYAGVAEQIAENRAKLKQKQLDTQQQSAKVDKIKRQVGQAALAQFQNRNLDTAAQLVVTQDAEGFLSQISTVEKISENQNSVLQDFQQQQAGLSALEQSAASDLTALQAQETQLKQLRAASEAKVADSKAMLAKLTEKQRQLIAAQEARDAAEAKAAAEAKTTSTRSTTTTTTTTPTTPAADTPPSSNKGAQALAWAKTQLGKPYRFGATGPDAYDCSGLTGAAWRSAGVSISRTSQAQSHDGRAVAQSDLQPGDLVFFYDSANPSHVGLYAGNGMILHAPRTGRSVEYIKMSYMPFAGARRPG
ncbi:MAG: peptidase family protein [Friedmanniella sp.]|nr:peptidase family protein [Friedmanniella sp.]